MTGSVVALAAGGVATFAMWIASRREEWSWWWVVTIVSLAVGLAAVLVSRPVAADQICVAESVATAKGDVTYPIGAPAGVFHVTLAETIEEWRPAAQPGRVCRWNVYPRTTQPELGCQAHVPASGRPVSWEALSETVADVAKRHGGYLVLVVPGQAEIKIPLGFVPGLGPRPFLVAQDIAQ